MQTLFRQGVVGQHPFEGVYKGNMLELASDTLLSPSTVAHIISRYLPKEGYMESICEDILANGGISKSPTGETVWVAYDPPRYSEENLLEAARICGLHSWPVAVLNELLKINEVLTIGILPLVLLDPKEAAKYITFVTPMSILQKKDDPDNIVYDHDGSHESISPGTPIGYSRSDFEKAFRLCSAFPIDFMNEVVPLLGRTLAQGVRSIAGSAE